MNIVEWFDPYNQEHLKAFNYLKTKGFWPENFIPDDIKILPLWQIEIYAKIANEWLKEKLKYK